MIGERIKELRINANMSQHELAEILGVSTSTIGMYEQKRRKPDIIVLKKLADIFDVNIERLMEYEDEEEKSFVEEIFASNVFTDKIMKEKIPAHAYNALQDVIMNGKELSGEDAQIIAEAMKNWAVTKGATHYSHWFQPLTGLTAEKQDSFVEYHDGKTIMAFSGKTLIKGETDASSFPSGGLRATFEARGYTTWDCTSPVFVREEPGGQKTLVIPTAFCSYNGMALDKKTPLLRSIEVINKQSVRLLHNIGETDVEFVRPTVGGEQEYFLVRETDFNKRRDLMFTGKTLFGSNPPKGQELGDQYYATISEKVTAFMAEVNRELWKLGVVAKTQHNEAAPAQYELALMYDTANIAADHNQLAMDMLKRVARRHGMVCLFSEKPFDNINGSGKHNNWSLVTNKGENIFKPGKRPYEDKRFMLFFTAVIAGVHEYANILRATCATRSNEDRIGGYEAPPAIISISTGAFLETVLDKVRKGQEIEEASRKYLEIGVSTIPHFKTDKTDRNRTSPFAFTGDKFEFRMVGSAQSLSGPNTAINTIVASKLSEMSDRLENADDVDKEIDDIIREWLNKHWDIIFNGNNYSIQWEQEAESRGLPNISNTVDAILEFNTEKAVELFEKFNVYSRQELSSRVSIQLETYAKSVNIEALAMMGMVNGQFIPACVKYTGVLAENINAIKNACYEALSGVQKDLLMKCGKYLEGMSRYSHELNKAIYTMNQMEADYEKAVFARDIVCPIMHELRRNVDKLENIIDRELWPVPTFADLLFY